MDNILVISSRGEFRNWLLTNHFKEEECWIKSLKKGEPKDDGYFYYLDAIEEALCFGWIDGVNKKVDGNLYVRFSPRRKNSNWTVLNIARVKRLQKLGLMTDEGLKYLPKKEFEFDKKIVSDIMKSGVYENFLKFPTLYQQVRMYNLAFAKKLSKQKYKIALAHFVEQTKENKMYGLWDDYGRLK